MDEQIKPVAVVYPDTGYRTDQYALDLWAAYMYATAGYPLYSQDAIDSLRSEVERLRDDLEREQGVREDAQRQVDELLAGRRCASCRGEQP